jgi:hypothetical protein
LFKKDKEDCFIFGFLMEEAMKRCFSKKRAGPEWVALFLENTLRMDLRRVLT